MELSLKYGHASQRLRLPAGMRAAVLAPGRIGGTGPEADLVRAALAEPDRLPSSLEAGRARPAGGHRHGGHHAPCPFGPPPALLLDEAERRRHSDRDITVVFGLGTHRPHTAAEQEALVGPAVFRRVHCGDSDPEDVERVGVTKRGTPVDVFRPVRRADVRVLVGVIEYHYFAGYSGGFKALIPGVCTEATIQANHRRMTERAHPESLDGTRCATTSKRRAPWWGQISS
jgi:hypothetical protein